MDVGRVRGENEGLGSWAKCFATRGGFDVVQRGGHEGSVTVVIWGDGAGGDGRCGFRDLDGCDFWLDPNWDRDQRFR